MSPMIPPEPARSARRHYTDPVPTMSKTPVANLFADVPHALADEQVSQLLSTETVRIERIVSTGQATPTGQWCDEAWCEWVVVLRGSAQLLFEGDDEPRVMRAGDFVTISAHTRHRVAWTDPARPTVWLAVHYRDHAEPQA